MRPAFDFDGRAVPFADGASVGAGLWAAGVREFRRTRGAGAPRGLFCAIGNCFDCLVDLELPTDPAGRPAPDGTGDAGRGTRPVRACRTPAVAGLRVRSSDSVAHPGTPPVPVRAVPGRRTAPGAGLVRDVEIAVVGAGPAGLAAAAAAAGAGARVLLLDAAAERGGQVHRRSTLVGAAARTRVPVGEGTGRRGGRRTGAGPGGFEHVPRVRVVLVEGGHTAGFRLHLDRAGDLPGPPRQPAPPELVRARAVVLCAGATEVVAPFAGWTTPGVLTAGGIQALLKGDGVRAGRRVLVAGTGPLLLVVAAGLAGAGARVTLAEESPAGLRELAAVGLASVGHPATLVQAAGLLATLARHRVRVLPGWRVGAVVPVATAAPGTTGAAATGAAMTGAVPVGAAVGELRVRLRRGAAERELRVDAVGMSHGLAPDVALAAQLGADLAGPGPGPGQWGRRVVVDVDGRTSIAGLFAAGELTGIAGAPAARAEGVLAGLAAARAVGHEAGPGALAAARRAVRHARDGARVVSRLWPTPATWWADLADTETLCRCEEVTAGSVRAAVAAGALTARAVKGRTRVGMGLCQGRVCGPLLGRVLSGGCAVPAGRATADAWLDSRPLAEPVDLARLAALD